MFAQLGDISFELITYFDGLEGKKSYTFAEHQVIEGKPRLQFIGEGLDEITIQLRFHVQYCDPYAEFKRIQEAAATHQALPFVFGNGIYKGQFVITEIGDTVENTAADGTLIAMGARVALKEWVDVEPLEIRKQQKKAKAPARKKRGKKHPKAKVEDVPQLTKESRAAGYKIVDKSRIVRMAK